MLTNSATAASFMMLTIRLAKLSAAACSALVACVSPIVDIHVLPLFPMMTLGDLIRYLYSLKAPVCLSVWELL